MPNRVANYGLAIRLLEEFQLRIHQAVPTLDKSWIKIRHVENGPNCELEISDPGDSENSVVFFIWLDKEPEHWSIGYPLWLTPRIELPIGHEISSKKEPTRHAYVLLDDVVVEDIGELLISIAREYSL